MLDGTIGYRILRCLRPPSGENSPSDGDDHGLPYAATLSNLLGNSWKDRLRDKTVIDFGCGSGRGSTELAQCGAARVVGIDNDSSRLEQARKLAKDMGVADRCCFTERAAECADYAISIDAFEHFGDPAAVLQIVLRLLRPGGVFVVSFGPTWYHPLGGHFFSVFPWSHLLFSERAQIRWRAEHKNDGATRFEEVVGGLNLMTIRRFEALVVAAGYEIGVLRLVPIRGLRWLHNRVTREFTTALVECLLIKPSDAASGPS